ncbi:MAG TPA: FtsK/SpoIIIE domain-containing protein [Herpetosiphonaceae bacterium]
MPVSAPHPAQVMLVWIVVIAILVGGSSMLLTKLRQYRRSRLATTSGSAGQAAPRPRPESRPSAGVQPLVAAQPVMSQASPRPGAPPLPATNDLRAATVRAIQRLPAVIPPPRPDRCMIPLLFDSDTWRGIRIGKDGHWGVFGTTGSGKGNALQHLALAALELGPTTAQLVVLDAKGGLDYGFCDRIAHARLYANTQIGAGCQRVLDEMERRTALLRAADARHIDEYNAQAAPRLPLLLVIADEIADFTSDQHDAIETVARMGRAVGIVLFVATQYPTAEVLTSQIQANVSNRVVFRLTSSAFSSVALRRQIKNDPATYEPAAIPQAMQGVAVLRIDGGHEILGRSPEITQQIRSARIAALVSRWPNDTTGDGPAADTADPATTAPATLRWTEAHIRVAAWLAEAQATGERLSDREIARRLFDGKSGGDWSAKAKAIRLDVEPLLSEPAAAADPATKVDEAPPIVPHPTTEHLAKAA